MKQLLASLLLTLVACVAPPATPDAGPPDLSTFELKSNTPLFRDPGYRFLKRFLLCGDGFVVWNDIGKVEIAEPRDGSDAIVTAQIADVTPRTSESGFKWGQLVGTKLYLGDLLDVVHVYDLSNHSMPRELGNFPGYDAAPFVMGTHLLYPGINTRQGVGHQVIDATNLAQPVYGAAHQARLPSDGFGKSAFVEYVAYENRMLAWEGSGQQLFELDVSDPMNPKGVAVTRVQVPSLIGSMVFEHSLVSRTVYWGWKVMDLSNPVRPRMVVDAMEPTRDAILMNESANELPLVRGGVLFLRGWRRYQDELDINIGGQMTPLFRYTLDERGLPVEHSKLPLPEYPAIGNPTKISDVCWDGKTLTAAGDRITFWQAKAVEQ